MIPYVLKYRAIDMFSEDWVSGLPLQDQDIKDRWYVMHGYGDGCIVKPETLCVCSFWKDMDGDCIFQNDVVELINSNGEKVKALCSFGSIIRNIQGNECEVFGFYFKMEGGKNTLPITDNYKGVHDTTIMKVIGNIIENPNLFTIQ